MSKKLLYPDVFAALPKENTPEPMGFQGSVWMDENKTLWFTPHDPTLRTVEVEINKKETK